MTDAAFELIRTFYVPFEDEVDMVTPVIQRALAIVREHGREITARPVIEAVPVDHLADVATVMRGERRVPTRVVLARLAEHNPAEYEGWTFSDLKATLAQHGFGPRKSGGVQVIRTEDVTDALNRRDDAE